MRVHPDTYPTRVTSFIAQTPSGVPEWFDWDDATTPRTDDPASFLMVPRYARPTHGPAVIERRATAYPSLFQRLYRSVN